MLKEIHVPNEIAYEALMLLERAKQIYWNAGGEYHDHKGAIKPLRINHYGSGFYLDPHIVNDSRSQNTTILNDDTSFRLTKEEVR